MLDCVFRGFSRVELRGKEGWEKGKQRLACRKLVAPPHLGLLEVTEFLKDLKV